MENATLVRLKALQEADDGLRECKDTYVDLSMRRQQGLAKMGQLRAHLKEFGDNLEAKKKAQRELEAESATLADKLAKNKRKMENVKSASEYTALTREAEFLEGRLKSVDDTQLEYMEQLEAAGKELADLTAETERLGALCDQETAEIDGLLKANGEREAHLSAERQTLAAALPQPSLRQYETIAKDRKGRAVTPASGGMCLACRMGFPPQLFNELQRNEKIIACPNCGRIMYWREHPDFKTEA